MMKKRVLALFVLMLFFAGCAKDESEKSTTMLPAKTQPPSNTGVMSTGGEAEKKIMPEQLISKEEAAELLGESVKEGEKDQQKTLSASICFYAAEKPDSKSYLQIAVIQKEPSEGSEGSGQQGQSGSEGESGGGGGSGGEGGSNGEGGAGGEEKDPKSLFEGFKKMFSDPNAAITGRIGDDTFISAPGLSILTGEYYIFVAAGASDPAKVQTILKQAGEMAVSNLKRLQGQ